MASREDILAYVKKKFKTEPDYPWLQAPDHAVLRHPDGKWFGLLLSLPAARLGLTGSGSVDILNVKCEPLLNQVLRDRPGFFPAYHMNKEHWITVVLDPAGPGEPQIRELIDASRRLTRRRRRKPRTATP